MMGESIGEIGFGMETAVLGSGISINESDVPSTSCLAVLFAEVSGKARLHEKLSGAEALRAVDRCMKRMERAIDAFGGRVIKTVGDGLVAVFGISDEALQAAVEMQQRVADLPPISGVKLEVRIGFSCGLVRETEGGVVGEAVNAAACLTGLAKSGQILIDLQAWDALSPPLRILAQPLDAALLRGKPVEMRVFEVVEPNSSLLAANSATLSGESQAPTSPEVRLRLRYAGKEIVLNNQRPIVWMGRDVSNDVLIHNCRASRTHAKLELRGDRIVFVDKSTNGTFVTVSGQPEFFLRKGECVLHGKGVLCFAASIVSPDADYAEFELF